jgi:hypothetical protein
MVIEKGVAPGETVVTDGQLRLFPGARCSWWTPRNSDAGPLMNLSRIFIERPIMTALVCFAICCSAPSRSARCRWRRCPAWITPPSRWPRPARRQSRDHGVHRGHAAGARVLHHRRHTVDELHQLAGQHVDHRAVHARPQDRRRRAGHTGRHLRAPADACRPACRARPPIRRSTRPSSRSLPALDSDTLPLYTVNEYADTCWRSASPW